jgi:proteasome assembly chaperone (PAC2) family protein
MENLVKVYARPKLKAPIMLASWPGVSNVSLSVATYMKKKLEFKRLAEIKAPSFFDPTGVVVRDNIVEAPQFPQSVFYYWKNKKGTNDVILFIGEDQPAAKSYKLANCVLDVGQNFQVQRIYTCAAALTRIHHSEQPRVWGVTTHPHLLEFLKQYDLLQSGNLQIAGLNGLLLGIAKERKTEAICLLGEVPQYATRIPNPMAALAILKVFAKMIDMEIDTAELAQIAWETREQMKQAAAAAMGEYIDYFTEPIWEQGEDEEGEESEDEVEDDQ